MAEGRVLALVQARMSSTRLPGKVLADVEGEPLLELQLKRLQRARSLDALAVATSIAGEDDPIAELAGNIGMEVRRGSLKDVLGRLTEALDGYDGPVVRLTGDCPLVDSAVVDAVVDRYLAEPDCAYATNFHESRTFPDGLDVEVISAAALREAAAEATDPEDREHVTPFIRNRPGRFLSACIRHEEDLGTLRWTVDRQDDLEFVRAVVRRLGARRYEAGLSEVLQAVRRLPSLAENGLRG